MEPKGTRETNVRIPLSKRIGSPGRPPSRGQRVRVAGALVGLAAAFALLADNGSRPGPDTRAWVVLAGCVVALVVGTLTSPRGYRIGRAVMATAGGLLLLLSVVIGGLIVSTNWEARHPETWPPEVVAVSPDGRVELVTQDVELPSFFFKEVRSRIALRWRGERPARAASVGCVTPWDLDGAVFTAANVVELRWADGQRSTIRFDPRTLTPDQAFGECGAVD